MSRTIRRKNLVDDWYNDQPHYFHSDMYDTNHACKKCRQNENIRFRMKNKQTLRLSISLDNYELPYIAYKKTADWECL